jgi:DNA-binding NarL/FixJ family response regulator
MSTNVRVAILDDHQSIIDGYMYRLSQCPEIEVVATAAFAEDLERIFAEYTIDVLLLDVNVPTSKDNPNPYPILHEIPRWLQLYPGLSILVISMHDQRTLIKNVMEAGASGYILKDDPETIRELGAVVRSIAHGGIYFSQKAHQQMLKHQSEIAELTGRQIEVISLCAAYPDKTSADLAEELGIAHSTVRNLLSSAYLRLGVRNRVAAITRARQLGLIAPLLTTAGSAALDQG